MRKLLVLVVLLASGVTRADESPFKIRGVKGLWWEGLPKYRLAMPWVAQHHMNFLMLCYSSFPASGRDWRADYSSEELNGFEQLAAQGKSLGVELCLSFNPGIWSKPPLVHASEEDFACALRKVKTVHARGVHSFALCLDDISRKLEPADAQRFGSLQNAQVYFVNRLWRETKTLDPRPRLIFCPSAYTTHDAAQHRDYIETIGREMDPEVMMFWTGPVVCSPTITRQDAEQFGAWDPAGDAVALLY